MEREIDKHERVKPSKSKSSNLTKIEMWRKAWMRCQSSIEQFENFDLKDIHYILEQWIPLLNKTFNNPFSRLDKFQFTMYFYEYQNGPKEIFQFYIDDTPNPENIKIVYLIFNLCDFLKILKSTLECLSGKNNMYMDEARGTLNLNRDGYKSKLQYAAYHKKRITIYLLFIYMLHALAHLHIYSIYKHAHYDNHKYLNNSPFFKLYYSGYIAR